jgi:hypothetical protein
MGIGRASANGSARWRGLASGVNAISVAPYPLPPAPVVPEPTPVLYSFRRCPYAIRARLALAVAGLVPAVDLVVREVSLRAKPPELLVASAKGTVPVLVLEDGVLDESLATMHWALEQRDPQGWLVGWSAADRAAMAELIAENDGPFKHHLDRFKYPERFAGEASRDHHRLQALAILGRWSGQLRRGGAGCWGSAPAWPTGPCCPSCASSVWPIRRASMPPWTWSRCGTGWRASRRGPSWRR